MEKRKRKRKSRKEFINNAQAWAYLIRVALTLVLLGVPIPDFVFLGVSISGQAVKVVIYCILDSIVDFGVIKPKIVLVKHIVIWSITHIRGYILENWQRLEMFLSNFCIDIRIEITLKRNGRGSR